MFETKSQKLASRRRFARRMVKATLGSGLLAAAALGVGTIGYHRFAGFEWDDSFLNASMILTGMGPVGPLNTTEAKLFASFYALFSGLIFLSLMVTLLTPVIHRVLHAFHIDQPEMK